MELNTTPTQTITTINAMQVELRAYREVRAKVGNGERRRVMTRHIIELERKLGQR